MGTAFSRAQYELPYPDGVQEHYWHAARHAIVARLLRRRLGESGGTILDVGCGRGIAVDWLRRAGWNALGCDVGRPVPISTAAAPFLTLGCDAFALPEASRRGIACLLLLDVLEHIEDPPDFLKRLCAAFPACRVLLATMPARPELWSNYDEHYGHFRRYTRPAARALGGEAAAVVETGYFFHLLYPPALLLRVLRLKRSLCMRAPGMRWPHRVLAAYFAAEERLAPSWLPGTSLYAVLRPVGTAVAGRHAGSWTG